MSSVKPKGSQSAPKTFKDRLDEAARESRRPANNREKGSSPSLMEKVAESVPAASGLLGVNKNNREKREEALPRDLPGPPNRPEHDDHIAEFVREQHRSKKPDGSSRTNPYLFPYSDEYTAWKQQGCGLVGISSPEPNITVLSRKEVLIM